MPGVSEVNSGYTGGTLENPKYEDICKGNTGHAEVVQIHYNPMEISYESILEIFWKIHDPTTLNSQGADIGTQYRSVIFYNSNVQKVLSEKSIIKAQKNFKDKIVTELSPLEKFYLAEDYHQEFYKKNPTNSYCIYNFDKKIVKVKDLIK